MQRKSFLFGLLAGVLIGVVASVAVDGRPRQVDWQIQAVVHGQSAVVCVAHRLATVATFVGIVRRLATALPRIRLAHRG